MDPLRHRLHPSDVRPFVIAVVRHQITPLCGEQHQVGGTHPGRHGVGQAETVGNGPPRPVLRLRVASELPFHRGDDIGQVRLGGVVEQAAQGQRARQDGRHHDAVLGHAVERSALAVEAAQVAEGVADINRVDILGAQVQRVDAAAGVGGDPGHCCSPGDGNRAGIWPVW